MPEKTKRQSIEVHRRVRVSGARKCKKPAKTTVVDEFIKKQTEQSSASLVDEPARNVVSHFADEPVLESELIQDAIASVTVSQSPAAEPKEIDLSSRAEGENNECKDIQRTTARETKEREIQKAIKSANASVGKARHHRKQHPRVNFGFSRALLALVCTVLVVLGVVYLVDANSPDMSLKVAAMQTGIDAVYPKYTPRGYALSDITSESGRVILNFKNSETGAAYSLIEDGIEILDSSDLLVSYVKETFGTNYTKVDEQGVSVYIGNNGAAWVSGGILYKLKISSGALTRKQIVTIATTK